MHHQSPHQLYKNFLKIAKVAILVKNFWSVLQPTMQESKTGLVLLADYGDVYK